MIKDLAARVQRIKPSPTLAVSARAEALIAAGNDVINLSVGEPDFDTPLPIKKAAIKAIQQGFTKYTAVDGTPGLKEAIIQKFARDNQLSYQPDQILVSCGAKHSFYNLFAALLNAGDEVIIPAPYWVSYPDMAKLTDADPVIVKADYDQHYKITPAQLEAAITPKTRLVIFNSPANPTGMAYAMDELKAFADVLLKYPNIAIASDDIYEHTLWEPNRFTNIVMACPALYDRTIVINGASKAYAMTGWRIGYAAGPTKLIAAMKKVQSQSTSNPCSISQAAVQAALEGDQACVAKMTQAYKERHDYIMSNIHKIPGIRCRPSDGTFYSLISVEGIIEQTPHLTNDLDVAEWLLQEAGVALIPGSAFGAPGHVRLSYAASSAQLKTAIKRLASTVSKVMQQSSIRS